MEGPCKVFAATRCNARMLRGPISLGVQSRALTAQTDAQLQRAPELPLESKF